MHSAIMRSSICATICCLISALSPVFASATFQHEHAPPFQLSCHDASWRNRSECHHQQLLVLDRWQFEGTCSADNFTQYPPSFVGETLRWGEPLSGAGLSKPDTPAPAANAPRDASDPAIDAAQQASAAPAAADRPVTQPAGANATAGKEADAAPEVPHRVSVGGSPEYALETELGSGGYGQVWLARRVEPEEGVELGPGANQVAIKFEQISEKTNKTGGPHEWKVLEDIGPVHQVPGVHYKGQLGEWFVSVMDVLGPSLWDVRKQLRNDTAAVAGVAVEALHLLRGLHNAGYVHRDVKPQNFLMGRPGTPSADRLWLIDVGIAQRWRDAATGAHLPLSQRINHFSGTHMFTAVHAQLGRAPSRRDDLEALGYTLVFLVLGKLPWKSGRPRSGEYDSDDIAVRALGKLLVSTTKLCRNTARPFRKFMEAAVALGYDEEPAYDEYIRLFEPLAAAQHKPLITSTAPPAKPGPKKPSKPKVRRGPAVLQWTTVYGERPVTEQQLATNLTDAELEGRLSAAFAAGLHIGAAACGSERWSVTLDAGSQLEDQMYVVVEGGPDTAEEIRRQVKAAWSEDYIITEFAGCDSGRALVVLSSGVPHYSQSFQLSQAFPYSWISRKWKDDFHVSALSWLDKQWMVVLTKPVADAAKIEQRIALDFQYPEEDVRLYGAQGFRVTSVASSPTQTVVVMSRFKGVPEAEIEDTVVEVQRTAEPPVAEAAAMQARGLYIASMTFGRTAAI